MEKLTMCRICLVENVRMYVVVNKNLYELYEKLTNVPFVTEDSRPLLACFICFTKLKQCHQLLSRCMEAENVFTQMKNRNNKFVTEDSRPLLACFICFTKLKQCHQLLSRCMEAENVFTQMKNRNNKPLTTNGSELKLHTGLIKTPVETINIVDAGQTESIPIKHEVPAYYEMQHGIRKPKEKRLRGEQEPQHHEKSRTGVEDIPKHYSKLDIEYEVPVIELKIEVEEEQIVRSASETDRATVVAKKPKLEDTITANHKEDEQAHASIARNQHLTTEHVTTFKEPFANTQPGVFPGINDTAINTNDVNSERKLCKDKPHKCDTCQRSFRNKSHLTSHLRIHTGEKPYKCEICQHSFTNKSNLTTHIRIHSGDKPFKCETCHSGFVQMSDLKIHIRKHTGEKPYKCDKCQCRFKVKSNLRAHMRVHTGEKPYKCDECQHSFKVKHALVTHLRVHTGEKPYKCDICQRRYNVKHALNTHMHVHTGEKPYKCDICQCGFNARHTLKTHLRVHTGETPYKCDICQSNFSVKHSLKRHIITKHSTAKKPYKCRICQRDFSRRSNLTAHTMRIHHSGEDFSKRDEQRVTLNDSLIKE